MKRTKRDSRLAALALLGIPNREIAKALGVSDATVSGALDRCGVAVEAYRARQRLRTAFKTALVEAVKEGSDFAKVPLFLTAALDMNKVAAKGIAARDANGL